MGTYNKGVEMANKSFWDYVKGGINMGGGDAKRYNMGGGDVQRYNMGGDAPRYNMGGSTPSYNMGSPAGNMAAGGAQPYNAMLSPKDRVLQYAKSFDPSNPESVLGMQKLLGEGGAGITDWQGNPIAPDSQWGYKSQSALDFARTGEYRDPSFYGVDKDPYGAGTEAPLLDALSETLVGPRRRVPEGHPDLPEGLSYPTNPFMENMPYYQQFAEDVDNIDRNRLNESLGESINPWNNMPYYKQFFSDIKRGLGY